MSEASRPGMAMSVNGAIPVADLGMTLFHEHLHMDATPLLAAQGLPTRTDRAYDAEAAIEGRWDPGGHPDNYRFTQDDLVAEELGRYRAAGGRTVVDQTPPGLGRAPASLRDIAHRSGLTVIMGAGHYLEPTHEPWVAEVSDDELADRLAQDCRDGDAETGIRPGIIGEVGTSIPVHPQEVRVLRAAARAAQTSGLTVSVHLHPWGRTGHEVLDVLLEADLPPERICLGHLNTAWDDERYLLGLADRGVHLAFDLFGFDHSLIEIGRSVPSDRDVAGRVATLVRAGRRDQVLISHDIGVRSRLVTYGSWGYAHIPRRVLPLLEALGCSRTDIERIMVDNPARLLTVAGL